MWIHHEGWLIAGLILLCYVLTVFLAPEIYLSSAHSFLSSDHRADFVHTFHLINTIYQGGVQLWAHYDQMPIALAYLVHGTHRIFNLLTALVYVGLQPFSSSPGELYLLVFAHVQLLSTMALQVTGSYLLLKRFSATAWITAVVVVYLNVFIGNVYYFTSGLTYSAWMPLFMHLWLACLEKHRLKNFVTLIVYTGLCIASGVIFFGYIYQTLHFFVLISAGTFMWMHRQSLKTIIARPRLIWTRAQVLSVVGALAAAAVMVLPSIYMLGSMDDYVLDLEKSRFGQLFSVKWYFTRDMNFADQFLPVWQLLRIEKNSSWNFLGYAFVSLAVVGSVFHKDRRKYLFLAATALTWCLIFPRTQIPFGVAAHTLNALTNPLNAFLRDFLSATGKVTPFLLAPLVIMGAEVLWCFFKGRHEKRFVLMVVMIGGLCVADVIFLQYNFRPSRWLPGNAPHYIMSRPELGVKNLDFQNPTLTPWRWYYNLVDFGPGGNDYLNHVPINMPGLFFHFPNMAKHFHPVQDHQPRHKVYTPWFDDEAATMMTYLSADQRMVFQADKAVRMEPELFKALVGKGWSRSVVSVEAPDLNLPAEMPKIASPARAAQFNVVRHVEPFKNSRMQSRDDLLIYRQQLPPGFPLWLSSTFLTPDSELVKVFVEVEAEQFAELKPAQGPVSQSGEFDINNAETGFLHMGFRAGDFPRGRRYVIQFPVAYTDGMTILRNTSDDLEFGYDAGESPGWLVLHYPYDTNWKITVNSEKQEYYKVNTGFIGFPISPGQHTIHMQYLPGSPLRALIFWAAIVNVFAYGFVLWASVKYDPSQTLRKECD